MSDKIFNHGLGISVPGAAVEYKVSHGPNGVIENGFSSTIFGFLGVDYNATSGELMIGISVGARGALIGGVEGYIKQGFAFQL